MMKLYKFQTPRIFVIKDIHGKEWTTKEGLRLIRGVCAADFKKYFYDLDKFGRRNIDEY